MDSGTPRPDGHQVQPQELQSLEKQIGGSWVTWAGIGLLLLALGYFLKFAVDRSWLTPMVRVLLGVGAGSLLYGCGLWLVQRTSRAWYGLTLLGAGLAALYTSTGSAYFALDLLQPAVGLLAMTTITALAVWTAWRHDSQTLGALALLGALVAPVIFPTVDAFILQRFAYVYAVVIGAVVLSLVRPWAWIRALAWLGAQIIFCSYLVWLVGHAPFFSAQFRWGTPFGIATGLFVLFAAGLAFESIWMRYAQSGWNLALSIGNAVAFAVYAAVLIPTDNVLTSVLLLCAVFYGALALIIRRRVPGDMRGAMLHLLAAVALLTVTASLRLSEVGITVAWTLEAVLLWFIGQRWQQKLLQWAGPLLWMLAGAYWLVVCWDVPWPHWFGVTYVPFVNPGALAWMGLAAAGFVFSISLDRTRAVGHAFAGDLATIVALLSHLMVGGLLTVQINNYFEAYPLATHALTNHVNLAALSVSWGVYALILVFWGLTRRSPLFRWFGLIATGLVLLKVFTMDLAGLDTVYKMIALTILGIIFIAIGLLYQRLHREAAAK